MITVVILALTLVIAPAEADMDWDEKTQYAMCWEDYEFCKEMCDLKRPAEKIICDAACVDTYFVCIAQ